MPILAVCFRLAALLAGAHSAYIGHRAEAPDVMLLVKTAPKGVSVKCPRRRPRRAQIRISAIACLARRTSSNDSRAFRGAPASRSAVLRARAASKAAAAAAAATAEATGGASSEVPNGPPPSPPPPPALSCTRRRSTSARRSSGAAEENRGALTGTERASSPGLSACASAALSSPSPPPPPSSVKLHASAALAASSASPRRPRVRRARPCVTKQPDRSRPARAHRRSGLCCRWSGPLWGAHGRGGSGGGRGDSDGRVDG